MDIDLRQLLSAEKFIPFYAKRKPLTSSALGPIAVELHWTSDCNYDCVHCSYGSRRQSKGRLSQECIQSVIDDLISLKASAVYLSGGGEPTIVKGWDKYAGQLMDAGIEVALITNGVVLQAGQVDVLKRMNYVAVSIYSTDEAEYRQITDSNFFDRQWTAPGLIKSGNGTAVVGARCVINKVNYRNLVQIYQKARESGYDYVIFIPAVDYEGRGLGLDNAEREHIKMLLSENREMFDPRCTNVLGLVERNVNHYTPVDYRQNFNTPPSGCSAIKIRANAFVNYCGGVWLCQPHIGNPRFRIGSLHENRFADIWNSSRHAEVVALLNEEFANGACRNCRSIGFNRAADHFESGLTKLEDIPHDPFI